MHTKANNNDKIKEAKFATVEGKSFYIRMHVLLMLINGDVQTIKDNRIFKPILTNEMIK